ncbi:aminopeptidase N [Sphingomonas japonica]|uniref:Aminopeptidase N n=1 Tax=Sphingomonas japonica TaxID=511662 RepID=A0ABX0TZP1_9SPHN|nr:aminopeptidase N [Sphingomonas japonica]NIJ23795.1 aminopeptidase N [Sphingomonas japonica]
MLDIRSSIATPAAKAQPIRRADYRPPDWLVPELALDFELGAGETRVTGSLSAVRSGAHDRPLRLDRDGIVPDSVRIDGVEADWSQLDDAIEVTLPGDAHSIEIAVTLHPDRNTQLMGLYASGGLLCTQCEAQGFRRILPFPDRPDVLTRYRVRMTADSTRYPVLLANGDPVGSGDAGDGRHWAEWDDPFPKPSYLFALVAGDLVANTGSFTTMSGREVQLGIWVRESDLAKTDHALSALKTAMAWDEKVYGREYDLDVFNIVAVDDFNFGAMENKGLNIFNSRYILADPDTATDYDYDAVAAVVAHEYFHNWSGNRVTCRDWFQLSLKEGFTVFRDQQFSADQGSPAVKRIEDVRGLRAAQFPEDAGPLAHPVRPDEYLEISNFYTATIYNKGAEVIRMMHTMLGEAAFRAGSDLYFDRHDGTAATVEDFACAMEDASGADLTQFRLWYSQAGTPRVSAQLSHAPGDGRARIALRQLVPPTPGQPDKAPMLLPLRIKLFGSETGKPLGEERLVLLGDTSADIAFDGVAETPVLSINRGFSAPVILDTNRTAADLAFLSAHDDDPFARYEAMQQLMLDTLVTAVTHGRADHDAVIAAVARTLASPDLDKAFVGEAVLLPSESFIGDQLSVVDPDAVFRAREALRRDLATRLGEQWRDAYDGAAANRFEYTPAAKGLRRLRNVALGYLAASGAPDAADLAFAQFEGADNMTDRHGALATLVNGTSDKRIAALDIFYNRYRDNPLVLDKWFSVQALSARDDAVDQVEELAKHRDFTLANPNRARALVGMFSVNQRAFHHPSGRGYRFVADQLLALDKLNPQTAAKLVPPLGRWKRFDDDRAAMMRGELERIVASAGLSKDMLEQAGKSLD